MIRHRRGINAPGDALCYPGAVHNRPGVCREMIMKKYKR